MTRLGTRSELGVPLLLWLILACALGVIAGWRYAIFRNGVDLGIFTQVIAAVGHGFSSTPEGSVNHLLVHWSPIIVTGWPFLARFGPVGLEYFQAILVAATLLPLWGLARARFGRLASLAVVGVAALYPLLWANGTGDFHEMAFVPALSALLVFALDRRRWDIALIAAAFLLCTKEDQFVILLINGMLFAVTARAGIDRRAGLLISGLAILMSALYFGVVRQLLTPHVAYLSFEFFDWRGTGAHASDWSFWLPRIRYVLITLAPLAFLPCISRYGLFLIPGFVEILASNRPITLVPGAHYSALLTGYAMAAFVDGAARLAKRNLRLARIATFAAAITSVVVGIFASPMDYWYYLYRLPTGHDARLERTLESLGPRSDVGAQDEIFSHLGLDPNASVSFAGQEWFVYDRSHYSPRWGRVDEPAVARAIARHSYAIVSNVDGIVVLRKLQR